MINFLNISDIDTNSDAVQEIRPSSSFLENLNKIILNDPDYEAIYGQIDGKFTVKLFSFELGKTFDVGDGLITSNSAKGIPSSKLGTHSFSDKAMLEFRGNILNDSGKYKYSVDILGTEDWEYYHTNLIVHTDVVDEVVSLLTDNQ